MYLNWHVGVFRLLLLVVQRNSLIDNLCLDRGGKEI